VVLVCQDCTRCHESLSRCEEQEETGVITQNLDASTLHGSTIATYSTVQYNEEGSYYKTRAHTDKHLPIVYAIDGRACFTEGASDRLTSEVIAYLLRFVE
jgi:hypothetical protein